MVRALVAGKFFAVEAPDRSFWAIRRYDHYLTVEEAQGKPKGNYETVAYARNKDAAKEAIQALVTEDNQGF